MTIATIFIMHMSKTAIIAINWDASASDVEQFRRRALKTASVLDVTMTEEIGIRANGVISTIDFTIRVP